jgi:hypothetical protein
MHTKDILAAELEAVGLTEMAENARKGLYHDFLSPLEFPELRLDAELAAAIKEGNVGAIGIRRRHHNGDYDASVEESEEWAKSPEGRAAFAMIARRPNS